MTSTGLKDIAPKVYNRYCLYIFYKDLVPLDFRRWDPHIISDTEIQYGLFEIPSLTSRE